MSKRKPKFKRWEVTFEFILPRNISPKRLADHTRWAVQVFAKDGFLIPVQMNKIRTKVLEELNDFQIHDYKLKD